jgi:hypothetical protein
MLLFISGKRFVGKDSLGQLLYDLCADRGLAVQLDAFAKQLKVLCCEKKGLDLDEFLASRELKEIHRDEMTSFYKDFVG